MNRYVLTNKKLIGYLAFDFSKKNGVLLRFENCTFGMTDQQHTYMMTELQYCRMQDSFKQWAYDRGHSIKLVQEDLSFERFWEEFDFQRNRIGAEKYWKKMSAEEKRFALQSIAAYKLYCEINASWYTKKYPDGYLGTDKLYMSEWYKIIEAQKK